MIGDFLHRWAPLAYLAIALPAVLVLCRLTPPGMVPDESSHFLRAVQIAQGEWVGTRLSPQEAGGTVPFGAVEVGEALDDLIGHPERKVDPARLAALGDIRWQGAGEGFAAFDNTIIYAPVFYLPAAGAVAFGRWRDMGVARTFALARVATGLTAVGLAALAIGLARRGRAILVAVLLLPMTLLQFASVSQDALLIAVLALVAGLCSRAAGGRRPLGQVERLAVFALLGLAIGSRPPYAPLLLLAGTALLGPTRPGGTSTTRLAGRLGAPLLACAVAGGWILFGAAPVKIAARPGQGVSEAGQLAFLLHHPSVLPDLVRDTLAASGFDHYRQFLGVVGWSDAYPPGPVHAAATLALALACALSLREPGEALGRRDGALAIVAWVAAWAAVHATLYLAWTPVGAGLIEGVQGRYFVPSAMVLSLAVPAMLAGTDLRAADRGRVGRPTEPSSISRGGEAGWRGVYHAILLRRGPALAAAGWVLLLVLSAVDAVLTGLTVLRRFYP